MEEKKDDGIDPRDPNQAAQGAAKMDSDLLKKYQGNVPAALAGYNWGQGNVDRQGLQNAPSETQNYIQKVMSGIGNAIAPSAQASEMPKQSGIQGIRAQYPQYNDLSDQQLADSMYQKFYSDMPKDQFYSKLGIQSTQPSMTDQLTRQLGLTGRYMAEGAMAEGAK